MPGRGVLTLLAALLLAGCGDDAPAPGPEQRYLGELRSQDSYFEHVPDEQIIDLADRMCAGMDAGKTLDDLNNGQFGLEASPQQVPLVFAFAIKARCPDHQALLPPHTRATP